MTNSTRDVEEAQSPVRKIFRESYLHGLKEFFSDDLSIILRVVWFLILAINLSVMGKQLIQIVEDFLGEQTITNTYQAPVNSSKLNRPSICFKLNEMLLYENPSSNSQAINSEALLHLGYIKAMLPLLGGSGLWLNSTSKSENLTWQDFMSLEATPPPNISFEESSERSQRALYSVLKYWGVELDESHTYDIPTSYSDKKVINATADLENLYSIIVDEEFEELSTTEPIIDYSFICLPIKLFAFRRYLRGERREEFRYSYRAKPEEPPGSSFVRDIVFQTKHYNWKHQSDGGFPKVRLEHHELAKVDNIEYILVPTLYKYLNLRRRECHHPGDEIYYRGHGETICFEDCVWKHYSRVFNCTFWEEFTLKDPFSRVCHASIIFEQLRSHMANQCQDSNDHIWCSKGGTRSLQEWSTLVLQTYHTLAIHNMMFSANCAQMCSGFVFCEEWEFEYRIVEHSQGPGPENLSGLYVHAHYSLPKYMLVHEEVPVASQESFISSLGGIISFYFGASVCGWLQLFFLAIVFYCRKLFGFCRNRQQVQIQ